MKEKFALLLLLILIGLAGTVRSQTNDTSSKSTKPLIIKKKPVAQIRGIECSESYAKISIKVTFDKSGEVTDTEITNSSNCDAFDKSAMRAAKRIKFTPAEENGEPITVTKFVIYEYRVY